MSSVLPSFIKLGDVCDVLMSQAGFLTEPERAYLTRRIASQQAHSCDSGSAAGLGPAGGHGVTAMAGGTAGSTKEALWAALCNRGVWYMGCCKILHDIAGFGIIFFTPMMVQVGHEPRGRGSRGRRSAACLCIVQAPSFGLRTSA